MFQAKTDKIAKIAENHKKVLAELKKLLNGEVYMYIDYANVRPWSNKLKWHIDLKRLKQFLDSFSNIQEIKLYSGLLDGDESSEKEAVEIQRFGYQHRSKPVKIMHFSIKASTVPTDSTALLEQFVKKSLLRKYTTETIEYLNKRFEDMNKLGDYFIEDRKCNFDVEIGVDMLLDAEKQNVGTVVLWSGDSDFHDPLKKLLLNGKKVILFATARRIAKELNALRTEGLVIFDIQKIRDFICWNRELKKVSQKQKGSAEADCP